LFLYITELVLVLNIAEILLAGRYAIINQSINNQSINQSINQSLVYLIPSNLICCWTLCLRRFFPNRKNVCDGRISLSDIYTLLQPGWNHNWTTIKCNITYRIMLSIVVCIGLIFWKFESIKFYFSSSIISILYHLFREEIGEQIFVVTFNKVSKWEIVV